MSSTVIYNGYQFSRFVNISAQVQPIYDEADRTVIANKIIFNVKDLITPDGDSWSMACDGNNIEQQMFAIEEQLSRSGGVLQVSGAGFIAGNVAGDALVVDNSGGGTCTDLMSGPKPRGFHWESIGADMAIQISFTVETTISPCIQTGGGNFTESEIMSFAYRISNTIGQKGFHTRTITGTLGITQRGGQQIYDSADMQRRFITDKWPALPSYMRNMSWDTSTDYQKLTFTVVDREIESPSQYPSGVVSISAPTRSRYNMAIKPMKKQRIDTTLTVRIELAQDAPRTNAIRIFDALLRWRTDAFRGTGFGLIFYNLEIEEDPYSNNYFFSCRYGVTTSFTNHLIGSRMFELAPGSWAAWNESMEGRRDAYRGLAHGNDEHVTYQDPDFPGESTVSLCDLDSQASSPGLDAPNQTTVMVACMEPPEPDKSWFDADTRLIEKTKTERTFLQTYNEITFEQDEFDSSNVDPNVFARVVKEDGAQSCFADAPPEKYWLWAGRIKRLGYPIPAPTKITIGGVDAEIIGEVHFVTQQIGEQFCLPVYEAEWRIMLVTDEQPEPPAENESDPTEHIPEGSPGEFTDGEGDNGEYEL